jgi:hypothetical protein
VIVALILCFILAVPLMPSAQARPVKSDSSVEAILIGEIKKIDRKNNTITVSSPRDITTTRGNRGGSGGGRRRGAGGGNRGGSGGGGGTTGGAGGGSGPLSSGAAEVESKVGYSTATVVKEEDKTLTIHDLHIGDFVRITERVKGRKAAATEINRTAHPSG